MQCAGRWGWEMSSPGPGLHVVPMYQPCRHFVPGSPSPPTPVGWSLRRSGLGQDVSAQRSAFIFCFLTPPLEDMSAPPVITALDLPPVVVLRGARTGPPAQRAFPSVVTQRSAVLTKHPRTKAAYANVADEDYGTDSLAMLRAGPGGRARGRPERDARRCGGRVASWILSHPAADHSEPLSRSLSSPLGTNAKLWHSFFPLLAAFMWNHKGAALPPVRSAGQTVLNWSSPALQIYWNRPSTALTRWVLATADRDEWPTYLNSASGEHHLVGFP